MQQKKSVAILLFVLAGLIVLLGIIQLALFMPPQLTMLNDANAQGVDPQQVSGYFWQQLMPQILLYVIVTIGFAGTLVGGGLISLQLGRKPSPDVSEPTNDDLGAFPSPQPQQPASPSSVAQPEPQGEVKAESEKAAEEAANTPAEDEGQEGQPQEAAADDKASESEKTDDADKGKEQVKAL